MATWKRSENRAIAQPAEKIEFRAWICFGTSVTVFETYPTPRRTRVAWMAAGTVTVSIQSDADPSRTEDREKETSGHLASLPILAA